MSYRTPWLRTIAPVTLLALVWSGAAVGCGSSTLTGNGGSAGTGASPTSSATSGTGATGGGATAACALGGDSCTAMACCSGLCTGGTCVCTAAAGNCQSNSQCCSGVCSSGVCAECNDGASLCSENANCCSGKCEAGVCSASTGSTLSCYISEAAGSTTVDQCSEYKDLSASEISAVQSECASNMGTLGSGCPTVHELGSCAFTASGISYAEFYYSDGGVTADDAQMACTDASGTWTPD